MKNSIAFRLRPVNLVAATIIFTVATLCAAVPSIAAQPARKLTIRIDASKPVASFLPVDAFGGGLDGLEKGGVARAYHPANVGAMAELPYHRLSYRLRTELGVHVWHWNEAGTWSDPQNKQGYWISSDTLGKPINISYGYSLPRRGNTEDQAGNNGYSRLTDGDEATFWKSNPYLDRHFTGDDNALHPQWVLIKFNEAVGIQHLRIAWGEPYATQYEVQYWDGEYQDYLNDLNKGVWRTFPGGDISDGKGGTVTLQLADAPLRVHFVRVLLKQSSGAIAAPTNDIRDRLGFAIRELYAGGAPDGNGEFVDIMRHGKSKTDQTYIVASSTDPWHRATDLDPNIEQPGLDMIMTSALTRGRAPLIPTGLIYDTPENAVAQIRYLKARGYPLDQIELGEEPDGQLVMPEHYGALYIQFAHALKEEAPALRTGGPGFQSEIEGWNTFPDAAGNASWMNRMLAYLRARGKTGDFQFFSFEWYPFDNLCEPASEHLTAHPAIFQHVLKRLAADGVPKDIPWIITEYGYSSFAGQHEVELAGALLNADIVAQYLAAGIKTGYLYGIEPNVPIRELSQCETWGNLMVLQVDESGVVKWRLPTFYGLSLVTTEWAGAPNERHEMFQTDVLGGDGTPDVAAYTLRRPNGQWAVLMLNKSASTTHSVRVMFARRNGDGRGWRNGKVWRGPLQVHQYSPKQYVWQPGGQAGRPTMSLPPETHDLDARRDAVVALPPMSITVVRTGGPLLVDAKNTQPERSPH